MELCQREKSHDLLMTMQTVIPDLYVCMYVYTCVYVYLHIYTYVNSTHMYFVWVSVYVYISLILH
jgi:hypothetical protein